MTKTYEVTRKDMTGNTHTVTVTAADKSDASFRAAGKLADKGVTFTALVSVTRK